MRMVVRSAIVGTIAAAGIALGASTALADPGSGPEWGADAPGTGPEWSTSAPGAGPEWSTDAAESQWGTNSLGGLLAGLPS